MSGAKPKLTERGAADLRGLRDFLIIWLNGGSQNERYQPQLPDELIALRETGFARWATDAAPAANFRQRFDQPRMPVVGIRHVRQWGLQVDDERELMGHERTSAADEEL
ncbi:MAG: hypothetical protein V9G98_20270 [Candidatus Competibacter sp.]